jgi:hypothetical protein
VVDVTNEDQIDVGLFGHTDSPPREFFVEPFWLGFDKPFSKRFVANPIGLSQPLE